MKNLSLKEKLKGNLRMLQIEDVRQYHLTHDYYSGRKLNSNVQFDQAQNDIDHEVLVEKQDLDYINELLFPKPTIASVLADALSGFSVNTPKEEITHQIAIKKPSDELISRLQNYYELYLNKGLVALLPTQSEKLISKSVEVIKDAYPNNTIMVQNICILSEFWIRSPFNWKPEKGTSLLDHLFVTYQVPACLRKCWNKTATKENLQWLIVFLLYVQGGSVKQIAKSFKWNVTNNKLWHELFQAPAYLPPEEAVLYCELNRLNGSANIYRYITTYEAYVINLLTHSNLNTVEFWYSMVRWLVLNEDQIIGTEVARVLVWARHQFTEFEKAGKQFSMNGRSCAKVQAETLAYHRAIVARRVEAARRIELRRLEAIAREQEAMERAEAAYVETRRNQEWPSYRWKKLDLSWEKDNWKFVELSSSGELLEEGEAMDNCVGSYDESCYEGCSAIVSLRYNGKRKVTIEIDPETRTLVQASGYANQDINQAEKDLIEMWLRKQVTF